MTHILIAEDEFDICELLTELLESSGYQVTSAANGMEALKLHQTATFDLIILDIMMPFFDGFEVAQQIRKSSQTPIIFLTALQDEENQVKGFDLGIDDYIAKPFSLRVLLRRIEAIIRRIQTNVEEELSFREITLFPASYNVLISGNAIILTLKEFQILHLLLEHPGRVLEREQLIQRLWGFEAFGDTRFLDTHIKNLRKKINVPYIQTVKGVGYKLEAHH